MATRRTVPIVTALALLSGCFQEKAPRQDAVSPAGGNTVEARAPTAGPAAALRAEAGHTARREAIYAMADAGEPNDAAVIGEALYDPDPGVRLAAVHALTGFEDEASASWLSIGLGDPDSRVRESTVEALGEVGGEMSRMLLTQALADADPRVREKAEEMLAEPQPGGIGLRPSTP